MSTNFQETTSIDADQSATTLRIPAELVGLLESSVMPFGYELLSTAGRNAMRVGCALAKNDPARFLALLNGNV